jgi:predicted nucleic acid-binding Zn ribbon protein
MGQSPPIPPRRVRRRRLYTLLAALVAIALAIVLVVVLTSGGGESNPATGNARDAVSTVQAFQQAVADRDYAEICQKLFTTDAREASGGGNCQSVLAQNASRIRNPKVQIRAVVLSGNIATVSVVAQVQGGPAVPDTIRLVRQKDGYRIASAGSTPGD